jgi:hypothetical protein
MQVKIYDYPENGAETLRGVSTLRDCFPDDAQERRAAELSLRTYGRYWAGGGAAPLVLLMPV